MVVITLTALIWIVTAHAVQEQRSDIRERAERALVGEAAVIAETISHELLMIDQSLTIVQAAWKLDSDQVNLDQWQKQMPALTAVADDLFICDENRIIRQDILANAIGQSVGAAYVTFPHGVLEQFGSDGIKHTDPGNPQADAGAPIDVRQFPMYVTHKLDHPEGWLVGASYRSSELTKLFAQAGLGYNPLVALVDTRRGTLQAVAGPASRRPNTDLSGTALFGIITRSPAGSWIGETAIDGVDRLHAFHQVADREMVVVIAANLSEVMAAANDLATGTRTLAVAATALVMAIGGLVIWELLTIHDRRRRTRSANRSRCERDRLRTEQAGNISRARLSAARLQGVLEGTTDGIGVFDASLRLVEWNQKFPLGIGIAPRQDMPLDGLLREQAAIGLFGPTPDIEAEISRRVGVLLTGEVAGVPVWRSGHGIGVLRGLPVAEGGLILLVNGLPRWQPASDASTDIDTAAAAPVEW